MTYTNKTRLAKRKLEIKEVRKDKQITTSKKHDKTCFEIAENTPKTSTKTKAALLEEMDMLRQMNEALLEDVQTSDKQIANLEKKEQMFQETIKELKEKLSKQNPTDKIITSIETQTSVGMIKPDDPLLISCNFCIYVATCEEEVNWHMTEEHLTDDKLGFETDFPCDMCGRWCKSEEELNKHKKKHMTNFKCRFCNERFETMNNLMKHNKKDHEQHVSACRNFDGGFCEYEENDCWFIHNINPEVKPKCTLCNKTLNSRSELQKFGILVSRIPDISVRNSGHFGASVRRSSSRRSGGRLLAMT